MHIIAAICAALVPVVMLLKYLGLDDDTRSAWKLLERIDIVVLIFCVLAVLLLAVSLLAAHRRSFPLAAAALLFAAFGLLLAFPLDLPAQSEGVSVKIGGYLAPLLALIGAAAAVYAAELAPVGTGAPPVGAGRPADSSFTTPLAGAGGGAPAPTGQPQAPAGGAPAPGWYDDPHGQAKLRYFDGQNWTEQTSN